MTLTRTDIIAAVSALLTLVGYLGLWATGHADPLDPDIIEALLGIALGALGLDTVGDLLETAAENVEDELEGRL